MELVGLVISALGLIVGVLLSQPVIDCVRRRSWAKKKAAEFDMNDRWVKEIDSKEQAFELWDQTIRVDAEGNAVHAVDIDHLSFPVYCEAATVLPAELAAWARTGRKDLSVTPTPWDVEQAKGRIRIDLSPPMAPRERRRVKWGYSLPNTFRSGEDYYEWYVRYPHYDLKGRIIFDVSWKILSARWSSEMASDYDAPVVKGSEIVWRVVFPEVGSCLRMELSLDLPQR